MEWPAASIILGLLGTALTVFARVYPVKTVVETTQGTPCATKEQADKIQAILEDILKEVTDHEHRMSKFRHALVQPLQAMTNKLTILVERVRRHHDNNDD